MSFNLADTIVALATPPGISALALLRLSGEKVREFTEQLLEKRITWKPQRVIHMRLRHRGEFLDDVVITFWEKPHSFTGEDTIEISCHGNPLIVQNILQVYLRLGARIAEPGEFTQRAFLNGRLDLTQAEGIHDLITAGTARALRGAHAMKEGKLGEKLQQLRTRLIDLLAHLEAYIDFPEEDITPETGSAFAQSVEKSRKEISDLLETAPIGRILREGVLTVIMGSPNVGKSSLLNALLRENRAIVSPTPGTTRDTIEAECNIRGLRLRLIDTAGQRSTKDEIEAEGVRRAQSVVAKADLILHLVDGSVAPTEEEKSQQSTLQEGQLYLKIGNKLDLGWNASREDALPLSIKTGAGFPEIEEAIEKLLVKNPAMEQQSWLTINARQQAALERALVALDQAGESIQNGAPPELISVDLRAALQEIGVVVGLATNEDILDQLFKKFCIGK